MSAIIDEIFELFARFGSGSYGENISLEKHMLQSATLAQSMGAPAHVITAALLHDIGHFMHPDGATSVDEWRDIKHESLASMWLSRGYGEDVTAPIALHVRAKRYLCAVEPGYFETLSPTSRLSLEAQGGFMNEGEVAAFEKEPAFKDALILRRCDDGGKESEMQTPTLEAFRGLLTASLRRPN